MSDTTELPVGGAFCTNPLIIGTLHSIADIKYCVDVANFDGRGNVGTSHCDGHPDQEIVLCGDGTIRNMRENYCMTRQNGNVVMQHCNPLSGPTDD